MADMLVVKCITKLGGQQSHGPDGKWGFVAAHVILDHVRQKYFEGCIFSAVMKYSGKTFVHLI